MTPKARLGFSIYCWDMAQQNAVLTGCFEPLLQSFRQEGRSCRFFFDRHGARGPHLVVLLELEPDASGELKARAMDRLEEFVDQLGAPQLGPEEAEAIHRSVGERRFFPLDRFEGVVSPNSWHSFTQTADGWPYFLASGLSAASQEAVWDGADLVSRAILRRLAAPFPSPAAESALLAAAFDRALSAAGLGCSFWTFFAASFLPGLAASLQEEGGEDEVRRIEKGIGGNRGAFARIWQIAAREDVWPEAAGYAAALIAGYRENGDWQLARELLHISFKQLMQSPRIELPLAFYGWWRSLGKRGAER